MVVFKEAVSPVSYIHIWGHSLCCSVIASGLGLLVVFSCFRLYKHDLQGFNTALSLHETSLSSQLSSKAEPANLGLKQKIEGIFNNENIVICRNWSETLLR